MPTRATSTPRSTAALIASCFLAVALGLAGVAAHAQDAEPGDPLERANRVSHRFGLFLDKAVLGPLARAYVRVTPSPVRTGVTNFIDNLTYPNVILNDFLQGKVEQGFQDSVRFLVNTTFGLVGFIDVASGMGLERHEEDFGQTLAVWGVKEIAYLDLPVVGPNSVRDVTNVPIAWQTSLIALADASGLAVPVAVLGLVNTRANASGMIEFRDQVALDSYVFTREAYRRRRNHLIMDGEVTEDDEDFYSAPSRRQEYLLSMLDQRGRMVGGRTPFDLFTR
jgi:phospholipid-binding lipoprotein MlaA